MALSDSRSEDLEDGPRVKQEDLEDEDDRAVDVPINSLFLKTSIKSPSHSSMKSENGHNTPLDITDRGTGTSTPSKMEPKQKLSRRTSRKGNLHPPTLYHQEKDQYDEATSKFQIIYDCIYANKSIGTTEPALECECNEEWDTKLQRNHACGEDSDCINRATKMECIGDCNCGSNCQNQRFQQQLYAKVTVFKTEKKGYGLRADTDLRPNDFIFEYIGEVITEPSFRRRMRQYDEEGIKHFYFMSLNKGEFIDATKKGNLGRFCNHSCNPNCYVDKWVVGDKLRMGIFAERAIQAGEELVFNYNVDRYGADPQPCYCGEPNCTGFIGGKTQTETGPKLSHGIMEALGLDDYEDEYYWETAVTKKPKKPRKTGEDDSEYVDRLESKHLEEDGVTKVMAALMQCKEKWIAVRLLARIQKSDDERVGQKVIRMHGYRIMKAALSNFIDDANVCLQVLDILFKLPRITRNKIQDSGIEETVTKLKDSEDERVSKQSAEILSIWVDLPIGYRIPRMKRDPNAIPIRNERRDRPRSKSRERSKSPVAPTGPKSNVPQRNPAFFNGPRHRPPRPKFNDLPHGWSAVIDKATGRLYYYNVNGVTTWTRPTAPVATAPAPPPVKEISHEERLQQIINSVTVKNNTPKDRSPAVGTPQNGAAEPKDLIRKDSWKSYSEEKQKKIYENTVSSFCVIGVDHVANGGSAIPTCQICA
jgi:[histone H3]-lysine36 N-trimethyltransferase